MRRQWATHCHTVHVADCSMRSMHALGTALAGTACRSAWWSLTTKRGQSIWPRGQLSHVHVRELFQRRRDRLRERRVFPKTDTTIEYFDAGSSFGLRDILTVRNDRRIINFYPNARLDGLLCRVEYQGQKIIERFEDRDDKLVYRSATYVQEVTDGDDANAGPGARRLGGADSKRLLPIRKMTEKYARNKEKDADEDVAKMVFYLTEGRIRLEYHFGEDRITNSSRMYHKSGQSQIVQVRKRCRHGKHASTRESHMVERTIDDVLLTQTAAASSHS
eukprot:359006-Chlamydomonas_euryale.AAC.3